MPGRVCQALAEPRAGWTRSGARTRGDFGAQSICRDGDRDAFRRRLGIDGGGADGLPPDPHDGAGRGRGRWRSRIGRPAERSGSGHRPPAQDGRFQYTLVGAHRGRRARCRARAGPRRAAPPRGSSRLPLIPRAPRLHRSACSNCRASGYEIRCTSHALLTRVSASRSSGASRPSMPVTSGVSSANR
jgi:hypothetical protein